MVPQDDEGQGQVLEKTQVANFSFSSAARGFALSQTSLHVQALMNDPMFVRVKKGHYALRCTLGIAKAAGEIDTKSIGGKHAPGELQPSKGVGLDTEPLEPNAQAAVLPEADPPAKSIKVHSSLGKMRKLLLKPSDFRC